MKRIKDAVPQILEVSRTGKKDLSWYFDLVLVSLILLNAFAIILESVKSLYQPYQAYFQLFDGGGSHWSREFGRDCGGPDRWFG